MTLVQQERPTPVKRSSNAAAGKQQDEENESVLVMNELDKNQDSC